MAAGHGGGAGHERQGWVDVDHGGDQDGHDVLCDTETRCDQQEEAYL